MARSKAAKARIQINREDRLDRWQMSRLFGQQARWDSGFRFTKRMACLYNRTASSTTDLGEIMYPSLPDNLEESPPPLIQVTAVAKIRDDDARQGYSWTTTIKVAPVHQTGEEPVKSIWDKDLSQEDKLYLVQKCQDDPEFFLAEMSKSPEHPFLDTELEQHLRSQILRNMKMKDEYVFSDPLSPAKGGDAFLLLNASSHCSRQDCPLHFCDCMCHRHKGVMHCMPCCHTRTCSQCGEVKNRVSGGDSAFGG